MTQSETVDNGPILITGISGQVGNALMEEGKKRGLNVVGLSQKELDFTEIEAMALTLDSYKPSAIINPAAYTAVDKAEEEEPLASLVNAQAPSIMAAYCRKVDIPFIHYSTDYVFNGEGGERPFVESDETDPLNAYGRTKLAGEDAITKYGAKHLIFRTSWVYDSLGKNFVNTMLRIGKEREQLKVVDDQWGAPTYAPHIAIATLDALENAQNALRFPSGLYHLCGSGETNWLGFAKQIFANAYKMDFDGIKVKQVDGCPSSEYPTPAMRPQNSRMDCGKAKQVLGIEMPHWEAALKECMEKIQNESA